MESLADTDPALADLADVGLSDLVRYQRVDFPRAVQRLDVTAAVTGALADPGAEATVGLAADLHGLSLTCLTAVAQHENLPELLSVAEPPEPLNGAKERCPSSVLCVLSKQRLETDVLGGAKHHASKYLRWARRMLGPVHRNKERQPRGFWCSI